MRRKVRVGLSSIQQKQTHDRRPRLIDFERIPGIMQPARLLRVSVSDSINRLLTISDTRSLNVSVYRS
jgi:hypothetical protein